MSCVKNVGKVRPKRVQRAGGQREAVHQLVAFPRVSRLVLAKVGGSGASPGAKVVGASGGQPGPLGCGTSVRAELATFGTPPLRPASGRVLPGLLPTIHRQV